MERVLVVLLVLRPSQGRCSASPALCVSSGSPIFLDMSPMRLGGAFPSGGIHADGAASPLAFSREVDVGAPTAAARGFAVFHPARHSAADKGIPAHRQWRCLGTPAWWLHQ